MCSSDLELRNDTSNIILSYRTKYLDLLKQDIDIPYCYGWLIGSKNMNSLKNIIKVIDNLKEEVKIKNIEFIVKNGDYTKEKQEEIKSSVKDFDTAKQKINDHISSIEETVMEIYRQKSK